MVVVTALYVCVLIGKVKQTNNQTNKDLERRERDRVERLHLQRRRRAVLIDKVWREGIERQRQRDTQRPLRQLAVD